MRLICGCASFIEGLVFLRHVVSIFHGGDCPSSFGFKGSVWSVTCLFGGTLLGSWVLVIFFFYWAVSGSLYFSSFLIPYPSLLFVFVSVALSEIRYPGFLILECMVGSFLPSVRPFTCEPFAFWLTVFPFTARSLVSLTVHCFCSGTFTFVHVFISFHFLFFMYFVFCLARFYSFVVMNHLPSP